MVTDALLTVIRERGYRITRQRRLVLEIILEQTGHLEADMLYQIAKRRDPQISLATIYRTLALLKDSGLVQEHSLGQNHGHFEAVQPEPHYHFTCMECERVIEFDAPQVMEIAKKLSLEEGVHITDIHLFFTGTCENCQS